MAGVTLSLSVVSRAAASKSAEKISAHDGSIFSGLYLVIKDRLHIVQCGKFHKIGGAPPQTFPNVKYDAPEEEGSDRKSFDSPIRK